MFPRTQERAPRVRRPDIESAASRETAGSSSRNPLKKWYKKTSPPHAETHPRGIPLAVARSRTGGGVPEFCGTPGVPSETPLSTRLGAWLWAELWDEHHQPTPNTNTASALRSIDGGHTLRHSPPGQPPEQGRPGAARLKATSPRATRTTTTRPARPTTGQRYPAFAGPAVTLEGDTPGNTATRCYRSRAARRRRAGRLEHHQAVSRPAQRR